MKKYILSALVVGAATMFTACDDMLDTDPRVTEATQATFPGKVADVEALNTATYSLMNTMGGGDCDQQNIFFWWEVMSDNCYGSGGLQDNKVKALHHLVQMDNNQYETPFILLYGGINRATNMIETIDNVNWKGDNAKRNQLLGEAFFMRGLYTLWLTQLFGDVPLITSTTITPEMEEQVDAETVIYPQIFADFVSAKNLMSTDKKSGHANKYVAEAFLARAYMFWAGFYKKAGELKDATIDPVQLPMQEGCRVAEKATEWYPITLAKHEVVDYLKDVYGKYELLKDYRSLWQYSNSYVWKETHDAALTGVKDEEGNIIKPALSAEDQKDLSKWKEYGNGDDHGYDFIADMDPANCFDMPGMGNGNPEEMFQIQFLNASRWGIGTDGGIYSSDRMYCNYLSCFWALRVNGHNGDRAFTYPFTQGWGQGTPSCNLWDDWTIAENAGGDETKQYKDIRKLGSLIDGVSENKEVDYEFVKDCCEASGYGVKKYNGVTTDKETGDRSWWYTAAPEGWRNTLDDNALQGSHFEDLYLMRYADVLLMLTELTGDKQYMNEVQRRAHVPETEYSLKAVQDERRWEFAFEGLRFNDMRRWTGKDVKGGYASKALQAQSGKKIVNSGDTANKGTMEHMTCSWTERYEATNGFLMKPQNQITVMEGKLKQNPGWDASDPNTKYKTLY